MWLANALTIVRIPLAIVFWATYGDVAWSLAAIALAAVSDSLDGAVARRARARAARRGVNVSSVGEWLDPVADKFFVLIVVSTIAVHEPNQLPLLLAICARELVVVPLGIVYRLVLATRPHVDHAFKADLLGKATTIMQMFSMAAVVGHVAWAPAMALVTGVLGITTATHYILRGLGGRRLAT